MAGERVWGTQFVVSSGSDGTINAGAVATPGGTNPYSTSQTADYPHLAFMLTTTFTTAPTAMRTVDIHIVPQQVDGTTDARDISASYRPYWVTSFTVDNIATTVTYYCEAYDVPKEGKIMLYNGTDQQQGANYTLKATPFKIG